MHVGYVVADAESSRILGIDYVEPGEAINQAINHLRFVRGETHRRTHLWCVCVCVCRN